MTFSARSFGFASSSAMSAASSSGVRPRGRVPLIGRVSTSPFSTFRNRSGDALENLEVAEVEVGGERRGVEFPQAAVQFERMFAKRCQQPLREVHLIAIPGLDILGDSRDGGLVTGAVEVAADSGEAGERELRSQHDTRRAYGLRHFRTRSVRTYLRTRNQVQDVRLPRSGSPWATSQARFCSWSKLMTHS